MGADRPDVTAIVVNWNGGAHLARAVRALLAAEGGLKVEVVVVDNASEDGSLEGVAGLGGVQVVETGGNLGFGRGANRGLPRARAEFVAILNPDVVPAPGALREMVGFLSADPDRALVGPRLLDGAGRTQGTCGRGPGLCEAVARRLLLHLLFPFLTFRRPRPATATAAGWVTGAFVVARRSALEAVGGFDEAIFMYFEDVDLCLRLNAAGWSVWYLPEAQGRHLGGQSSKRALERSILASEQSYRYFIRKHLGPWASRLLCAMAPVEMALRLLLWSVLAAVPARRKEAKSRLRAYRRLLSGDWADVPLPSPPLSRSELR